MPCRVCGRPARIIDRIRSPNCDEPVPACKCRGCGHLSLYPEQYQAQKAFEWDGLDYYLRDLGRREAVTGQLLDRLCAAYRRAHGREPRSFLDAGCALGWSLRLASMRGMEAVGIEPEARLAAYGRETLGLDVRHGRIGEVGTDNARFELVYCEQVLEHVESPPAFLRRLAECMAPHGLLYVGVPPAFPLNRATTYLLRKTPLPVPDNALTNLFHDPDEHVSVFSGRSMRRLAADAGLMARPLPMTRSTRTARRLLKAALAAGANPGTWLLQRLD